jgi:arylformamidase
MPSRVIDISLPLPATPSVPGDPPFARRVFLHHAAHGCEAAAWSMSAHAATHIDFPAHFLPGGKRAGDYPADAFVLPAVVVDCGQALRLGPELLAGADPQPGEAVLLATRNSREGRFAGPDSPADFAAATPALARDLVSRGVVLAGLDAMSIEPLDDPAYPVHTILLSAGVLILEGLDLSQAPVGRCRLVCLPLAVPEAEASPTRAVLLV